MNRRSLFMNFGRQGRFVRIKGDPILEKNLGDPMSLEKRNRNRGCIYHIGSEECRTFIKR